MMMILYTASIKFSPP